MNQKVFEAVIVACVVAYIVSYFFISSGYLSAGLWLSATLVWGFATLYNNRQRAKQTKQLLVPKTQDSEVEEFEYDVFIASPVRNITAEENELLLNHEHELRQKGYRVYRSQNDLMSPDVFDDDTEIAIRSRETHIWWHPNCQAPLIYWGIARAFKRDVVFINAPLIKPTEKLSLDNQILDMIQRDEEEFSDGPA